MLPRLLRAFAFPPKELTMQNCHTDWPARLLRATLMAALLLSVSLARGQGAGPARTEEEKPPLPSKKAGEEEPPLPSKKPDPAKEVRVQVTAASAEVKAGDEVVATVRRGEVLPFTKKTDDYYLVLVNGKKGWIKREAVREVEVTAGRQGAPASELPPGPAPADIDKETRRLVKQATAYLRVRLADDKTVEGSGFFAFQPGLVLTNAHVLGMLSPGSPVPAEVRVVVHSGEPEEFALPAQVLAVDRDNDLGVLRVQGRANRLPTPLPVDTSRALDQLQKVYIYGFPFGKSLGKDITASESSVSSIRKDGAGLVDQIQVNGGIDRGNSGGPVVDSRGAVVGVAVSGIRGTQIKFAVPGERVLELLGGRVAQTQFGEAFSDKDQAKLPVRLSCLDPLQRIRAVQLEVWAGKPSPDRPGSATEPKPRPGDGTRQSVAAAYQDGGAQVDVAIPKLADGEVLWVQPVLTDTAGATRWAKAVAYKPSDLPPLERQAVLLQADFDRQAQRTVKLTRSYAAEIAKGRKDKETVLRESMEVEMLEAAQKQPGGGRVDLSLGTYQFTAAETGEKPRPLAPEAQKALRNQGLTFVQDSQGAMRQRTIPALNPRAPAELREDFADLVQQIANGYEMTCLPVPNRRVAAQETWQAQVPLLLTDQGKKKEVVMYLTCTYEGSRGSGEKRYAVISLSGHVKGRTTTGLVTGTVHFAVDDGYPSRAQIKVESEGEYDGISVAHSLELLLTRAGGNTAGIVARPVAPLPGAPADANPDYERAIPHFQKRDFDQAIPLLEKAVDANPNFIRAQLDLGFAYNQKRLFDKAIPCFKKVIELDRNNASAHNNLGAAYNGQGRYDDAIPCFEEAIKLDPNHAAAHFNLGVAYSAKKQYDESIQHYEKAVAINDRYVAAHINLGNTYNERRLRDKAIACFKRAVELDKNNVTAHNALGFTYNALGRYDDAIPCFKKVLAIDPKHATALNNLGFTYNALGLYDEGIPWLKKAAEVSPKSAVALNNLAAALRDVGELRPACDALKEALALVPETAPQYQAWKRDLEQSEALLRLEPELPEIVKGERKTTDFLEGMRYGKLCRYKQHYGAALRFYEQALANDPDAAKKLGPQDLTILARTALLASAGKGSDPPPEADRPKYRAKALVWLQRLVKAQHEALEKDFNANRYSCQLHLRVLLQHKDLAPARPPALNNFPAAERKEWESFWDEVETLLEKADALPPDPSAGQNP
jgi:tetratricopeptide (TPR) repeat protein/S1-C subfamily serine protease